MRNSIVLIISVVFAALITSCQDNPAPVDYGITLAEDEVSYIVAENALGEEITAATYGSYLATDLSKSDCVRFFPYKNFPDCAEVTVSGTTFPKEITIDFGDECIDRNGNLRTGVIYITITDRMINPGAEYTIVYDGVTFGEKKIDRVATILNEGQNDDGNWVIAYNNESTVYYGDTLTIKREFSGEKEWIDGFLTPEFLDNKFYTTGGGTITVNDDLVFERNIIEPLYIDRACRFILSGVVEITRDGEVMTIDFGDGECDSVAVVTKDGESEEIDLATCRFKNTFRRHMRHIFRLNGWW